MLSSPARSRDFFGLNAGRHAYLCPQTLFKFHPEFDAVWRGILESDPLADLVVLDGRVPNWTRRLRARWSRTLPDAARRGGGSPRPPPTRSAGAVGDSNATGGRVR